jgi:Tfp pilus assembly major pilin PilA
MKGKIYERKEGRKEREKIAMENRKTEKEETTTTTTMTTTTKKTRKTSTFTHLEEFDEESLVFDHGRYHLTKSCVISGNNRLRVG